MKGFYGRKERIQYHVVLFLTTVISFYLFWCLILFGCPCGAVANGCFLVLLQQQEQPQKVAQSVVVLA